MSIHPCRVHPSNPVKVHPLSTSQIEILGYHSQPGLWHQDPIYNIPLGPPWSFSRYLQRVINKCSWAYSSCKNAQALSVGCCSAGGCCSLWRLALRHYLIERSRILYQYSRTVNIVVEYVSWYHSSRVLMAWGSLSLAVLLYVRGFQFPALDLPF